MHNKLFSLLASLALAVSTTAGNHVTISISNTLNTDRSVGEMVEIPVKALTEKLHCQADDIVITTNDSTVLPTQLTYDGYLIFQRPDMKAKEQLSVVAIPRSEKTASESALHFALRQKPLQTKREAAISESALHFALRQKPLRGRAGGEASVFGRLYPERQSDFSFENDRMAYRIYGPETQKNGGQLYGYDIFNKSTSEMVLDEFYAAQCDPQMWNTISKLNKAGKRDMADDVYYAIGSYHVDHGKGMDCYRVGPTLGAGTNALILISTDGKEKKSVIAQKRRSGDGKIIYPWCFTKAEVLDNGPLRLTVRLTYSTITVMDKEVTETRTLTIDAGSSMVKAVVEYSGIDPEMAKQLVWCAGIAAHKEHQSFVGDDKGIIAYEDYGDAELYLPRYRETLNPTMGSIFIGCVMPKTTRTRFVALEKPAARTDGHILAIAPLSPNGASQTYYFGNAWSRNKNVNITTMEQWLEYLNSFYAQINKPLVIKSNK